VLYKYCLRRNSIRSISESGRLPTVYDDLGLRRKVASAVDNTIQNNGNLREIVADPSRFLYVRNWAISSLEEFGPNANRDAFENIELRHKYSTFNGANVRIDHRADTNIGVIPYSWFVESPNSEKYGGSGWVEVLLAIDKEKCPVRIIEGILNGTITDTSMGCYVRYSICSICGNKAYSESQFCPHVRAKYGGFPDDDLYEINRDVYFYEDSIITTVGADENAKILDLFSKEAHRNNEVDIIEYVERIVSSFDNS